ncbi:ABC transporter ATP-binding protein [Psychrobium sp. 1_MG-2023]|uniref:ABC transporter ATP-binding protein n=1 Tax=Psychrobium sp. 1_MG-2023 TaxID=3062624 RepID=UPI000C322404|nr:ABC transporter ATP-binding protein [Psychrobium sp. 1_MG-2023]MDP2559713.1 ABC transporter ATP-binding protein [Psychrobium sp. 1_MG-2023]PKF59542.1 ABC transporter [Alteromonadales bacterium alter-6D02]
MSEPLLQVSNLCWAVANKNILNDITFNVKQGEFIGIIGPNGSGKTSLLRTLYRYTKPSSGCITLAEKDIWQLNAAKAAKAIAVVPQAPSSLPYSVFDVVKMGLTPHKGLFEPETADDLELVSQALTQVDLVHLATSCFDDLSGGEQQRTLIARAIVQRGQLLIMDEPTNHLDIHYQIDLLNRVKNLGETVIASLHDLNIASAFCDRLILLNKGHIIAQGTPDEVLLPALISQVYNVKVTTTTHPDHQHPHLLFHYWEQQ